MRTITLFSIGILVVSGFGIQSSFAATIPAGTTIVVKTADTISSDASPGRKFAAVLAHSVAGADGKVALATGTTMTGKVVTSKRMQTGRERLTVDLIEASVGGKTVHIKTTGAISLESYTSSRGVSFSPGHYHVAQGRKLTFHLGHALSL